MIRAPACSVIITNYNYGRFLGVCIDSALNQTACDIQVIVVDDGSTDGSRELIAEYGDRITAVLKVNGGQASAFNAGFAASTGDVIIFLDADDLLAPSAVETALPLFEDRNVVKAHWPLHLIDERGRSLGRMTPDDVRRLPEGDLREAVLRDGPTNRVWPPTSGNAWSRRFLETLLPMDERPFRIGADNFLFELAPFYGVIRTVRTPQSFYRLHDQNSWATLPLTQKLRNQLCFMKSSFPVIARYCETRGWPVDPAAWRASSWWCKLARTLEELDLLVAAGEPFILVDDGAFGLEADNRRRPIPLPERGGNYWGPPPDDASAIAELRDRVEQGIVTVIVAWPAFWWLDHYRDLRAFLDQHFSRVLANDRLVAFRWAEPNNRGSEITGG
jgi:glycosyltransferase involved in cell wall biosynthesis